MYVCQALFYAEDKIQNRQISVVGRAYFWLEEPENKYKSKGIHNILSSDKYHVKK